MLFFAFLLFCIQGCLVQNVLGQCIRPYPTGPVSAVGLVSPLSSDEALAILSSPFAASVTIPFTDSFLVTAAADHFGAYGGAGIGEIVAVGSLPVFGTTLVAGQVPIVGGVEFGGIVPAAGAVTIAGTCACGCAGLCV